MKNQQASGSVSPGSIDRAKALRIITALRDGRACLEGAGVISVGRDLWIRGARETLEELEVSDHCTVRWIKGRVGTGKTHFFGRVIEVANERNWVTSFVVISGRGEGTELHRFEEIYAAILRNCMCRDLIEADQGRVDPGKTCGWEWILDRWYADIKKLAGGVAGEVPFLLMRDAIEHAVTLMRRKWSIHGSFSEALRQFALARAERDEKWAQTILDWFLGANVHSLGSEVKARLKSAGIREPLNRRNAKELLRSLSAFIRYRGFGGILVMIDELENVLRQTPTARSTAYTILRELIDNADDRHGMIRANFYISGTPDVFESQHGLAEYEALASRVLLPAEYNHMNPRASVVDLGRLPLSNQELLQIAERIAYVHSEARTGAPAPELRKLLDSKLKEMLAKNPDVTPRQWVKAVVDLLDSIGQGKN